MKKNNITNHDDGSGKRDGGHPARGRRLGVVRLGLLALMLTFALGVSRCPTEQPPYISCGYNDTEFAMRVEPGACVVFANPCANHEWSLPGGSDGFRLEPTDEQRAVYEAERVSVKNERSFGGETIRSICVAADAPLHNRFPIDYHYWLDHDYGIGTLYLTVAHPLTVSVTATPSNIAVGESSQLLAIPSGGIPPYSYRWTAGGSVTLDRTDVAAPITTPSFTQSYTVTVSDSNGKYVNGSIIVFVGLQLAVVAHPEVISAGDESHLHAILQGGIPPYSVTWTPEEDLDDAHSQDPRAHPTVTTTYHVTAFDSAGATATREGSVTVVVDPPLMAHAEANPSLINLGQTSQLNVSVTGGRPPYSYTWGESNATSSLSDRSIQNPIASPTATTTYDISVRDTQGHVASDTVKVTVITSPPPTASFVFNVICCPTLNLDASASTGNIVSYTWDLSWTPVNPDRVTSSPTTTFPIREFDRGTITLTVTDAAGNTATTTRNF